MSVKRTANNKISQAEKEISSWEVRAYDFYSRVEKHRKNKTSKLSDRIQRVNKHRIKHFPWCYLFILLVLGFISVERKANDKISLVEKRRSSNQQCGNINAEISVPMK